MKIGTKVRFTRGPLGASEWDNLSHVVQETFGEGDCGTVAFQHPGATNRYFGQRQRDQLARTWYVEVESRTHPGTKLYVGENEQFLQVLVAPGKRGQ